MENVTLSKLVHDLRQIGIVEGDEVLMHSSLSSIGYVEGGAQTVVKAMLETVHPAAGTVLAITATGTAEDSPVNPPKFHIKHTRCWTGTIPETMRHMEGAIRSLNATHSVTALGYQAANLTTGHEDCWTPCGYGSPYYRLGLRGGKILLLGVTLDNNTTLHSLEELADCPYHLQSEPTTVELTDAQERTITRKTLLHDWGTPRQFRVWEDDLLAKGIMRAGLIGKAKSYLIDTHALFDYGLERLRENPNALVKQN